MKRVVVIFDTVNCETGAPCRIVKIWNTDEPAIKYVNDYMDLCKDIEWSYCSDLNSAAAENPGETIEFYGYTREPTKDLRDIISVFHIEAEDPDDDPMKRILRTLVKDFKECIDNNDASDEELEHMPYTVEVFERILKNVDEIEAENKAELTINKEENNNV